MREKGRRGSLPAVKEVSLENAGRELSGRWWTERFIALIRRRLDGEDGYFFLIFILIVGGLF